MIFYNQIGKNYNATRRADERITQNLTALLNCPRESNILDVGAGTGNYSFELAKHFKTVSALEPSETMIEQAKKRRNLKWYKGFAEDIPFSDNCFDGAICTLASHHFSSLEQSLKEIHRVLKPGGRFILFTFDARKTEKCDWLREYFAPFYQKACETAPPREIVTEILKDSFKNEIKMTPFKLPYDLKDGFFYSAWRYPEKYLNGDFRKGISVFSMAAEEAVDSIIRKLEMDLKKGIWDDEYSHIRKLKEYDGGYYFLTAEKF